MFRNGIKPKIMLNFNERGHKNENAKGQMMDFKVFKGRIKTLGSSTTAESTKKTPITTYDYIDMYDGQRIKKLITEAGLDEKLKEAKSAGEDVEFHVILHPEGTLGLLGMRAGEGKIFATNIPEGTASRQLWLKAGWILGVLLVPLLGVGLIILWHTWKFRKVLGKYDEVREYIASLPDAIII